MDDTSRMSPQPYALIHLTAPSSQATEATHTVRGRHGQSLMRAAVDANIDGIAADCGGSLSCATCHVVVAPEWIERLPAASAQELSMLEMTASPREAGSRLSCQLLLTPTLDGLTVRLPESQY